MRKAIVEETVTYVSGLFTSQEGAWTIVKVTDTGRWVRVLVVPVCVQLQDYSNTEYEEHSKKYGRVSPRKPEGVGSKYPQASRHVYLSLFLVIMNFCRSCFYLVSLCSTH